MRRHKRNSTKESGESPDYAKISLLLILILLSVVILYLYSSLKITKIIHPNPQNEKPITPAPAPLPEPIYKEQTFKIIKLTTDTPKKELIQIVGAKNLNQVLELNRINDWFIRKDMEIVVPNDFSIPHTPYPKKLSVANDISKIFIISQKNQSFGAYENGILVRDGVVSSGKESTPTPNGLFFTNWKGKEVISTSNEEWILKWNFNIDNENGIGIHQYELPGYPASHSCVRLFEDDAIWFYNWANQWTLDQSGQNIIEYGTAVILYGDYDFNGKKPWLKLAEDSKALDISQGELSEIISRYLDEILESQNKFTKVEPSEPKPTPF